MHALTFAVTILLCAGLSAACHSFKDTKLSVVTDTGKKYNTAITGCFERKEFADDDTVVEIYVERQPIPAIERDSIRHLVKLKVLMITECGLQNISADVFRNVPRLRLVKLAKNDLRQIERGVFTTLEALEKVFLDRNRISRIDSGALGNSSRLKEVNFGFNELEAYSSDWFRGSNNLQVMNFQNNKIKELPRRAFHDLHQLKRLSFDNNELEVIHPEVFSGISRMDLLSLRYNKLKTLNPRSFPNGLVIDLMKIDANYLNFISYALLANLQVKELVLMGNPWKCPCLDQIHHWLLQNNGTVRDSGFCKGKDVPVCFYSSTYSHSCRESVDDEVSDSYLGNLKERMPDLGQYCARLDRVT